MSELQSRITTCNMDCPDGCALEVGVSDGRIVSVGPAIEAGTNFICGKVANFAKRVYHQERVMHPLRRTGAKGSGHFEVVSWPEAIDAICENMLSVREDFGGEAIVPYHYGGSNGALTDGLLDDLFFARLGASRLAKTICAVPATEIAVGMYGKMPGVAFEDYADAQCIVIWGANPKGSNIHLVPFLRRAKGNGAFIANIDPRNNFGPGEIDLHLPVMPGQDLPVALAMINRWRQQGVLDMKFLRDNAHGLGPLLERAAVWTLERAAATAAVRSRDLAYIADKFAESSPAVVRCGWGLERNKNGAQAIGAVLAIPALLGKFGVRGGGYTLSNNGYARFDRDAVIGPLDWTTRELNMTQLGRQIDPVSQATPGEALDPPIKTLFVYNANPVASTPHQGAIERGLAREDLFTVVHDQVLTDTARWADIVLPAATFLEGTDLRMSYGDYVAGGIRPVIEPVGEARTNMQVFSALAKRLGMIDEAFEWSDAEILERVVRATDLAGQQAEQPVADGGRQRYGFAGHNPVQFDTVRPRTWDGKAHLTPAQLGPEPYVWRAPANSFPLAMVTAADRRLINSTFGETSIDTLSVAVHPDDAARRAVVTGSVVRVFNQLGEVHCHARVTDKVRSGVVWMPKGAWKRSSLNGATSTALCPDDAQVVGDAACFNDARVDVALLDG